MKKKIIKSAIPIYGAAAVWLLLGLICPQMRLKLWFLLLTAALSAGAYFGLSRVFRGREVEVREAARSGDTAALKAILSQVLSTDEGKRLAEKVKDAMQDG